MADRAREVLTAFGGAFAHYVQVTVQGSGIQHSTLIPANQQTAWHVNQMVNYARTLTASA